MKFLDCYRLQETTARSTDVWMVEDPSDGKTTAVVNICGEEEVNKAVEIAAEAFLPWKRKSPEKRSEILRNVALTIQKHKDELADIITMEVGKPRKASYSEVENSVNFLLYCCEEVKRIHGHMWFDPELKENHLVLREPVGVCGVITPYNYPLSTLVTKVGPALSVGCPVVVKPDEHTPLSTLYMEKLVGEAGLPEGVFNVVTGPGTPTGDALVKNPAVRVISFTGSTEVGMKIYTGSAPFVRRLILELGGNCAALVDAHSDWKELLPSMIHQAFKNSGQYCYRITRFLVHEAIFGEFVKDFIERVKRLRVGDPKDPRTDLGPLNNRKVYEKFRRQVERVWASGAKLEVGELPSNPTEGKGFYCTPLVFSRLQPNLVEHEEFFGPVAFLYPYADDEEALNMANASPFGLAAYVFTRDMRRAALWMSGLEAGSIWINSIHQARFNVPFGGYKASGLGREKSRVGFEEFTELKTVYWPFV